MASPLIKFEDHFLPKPLEPMAFNEWIEQAHSFETVDLAQTPCDATLFETFNMIDCIKSGALPWQKIGNTYVFLSDNATSKEKILELYPKFSTQLAFAQSEQADIDAEFRRVGGDQLLKHAHNTCPNESSVKSLALSKGKSIAAATVSLLAAGIYFSPLAVFSSIILFAAVFIFCNAILRSIALLNATKMKTTRKPNFALNLVQPKNGWPSFTILVPLYRESSVLYTLLENLIAMDYPKGKLDIKLLIEANDDLTISALAMIDLPSHIDVVMVPNDTLKTKPKAMNFALPFCRNDIIGIYDAEDKPDVMQLRHVAHEFAEAPVEAACVQCELDFFNTRQNWFTRCFTIEYRIWFSAILPVIQKMGMAVPLGGTSVFVKREVLEKVGAWDAYNVTEDADLGIRLKRHGYETRVLRSRTMEEANSKGISWIRQRSRWLKGYMMTWLCHMRNPAALFKDLGLVGFLGFHTMFLGAIVSYLSMPLYWLMWLSIFGADPVGFSTLPFAIKSIFYAIMIFSQVVNCCLAFMALRKNDNTRDLFKWYLTMTLYWPLGAIAAYKATIEVIFAPFYWDKTSHGHTNNHVRSMPQKT